MPRILMLTGWLPPDYGAVGQYSLGFAKELAAQGHDVTLVGLSSASASVERTTRGSGRLTIRRIRRPAEDGGNLPARVWWMLRSNCSLLWAGRSELRTADELRFTADPGYMLHFAMPFAKLLRVRTRYRITDFHPECLIAALGRTPLWLWPIAAITRYWRRRVDVIEVLGEDQRRRLEESRVDPSRIELRRDPSPVRVSPETRPADRPLSLAGRRVVLYSGNWGAWHDHETFVDGFARFCATHPSTAGLWINAAGRRATLVEEALRTRGLPVARTHLVPLDELPGVLAAADIHLVSLHDAFVGYVLPSKVYACVESGKPILFVGSAQSDVHLVCGERMPASKYRRVDVGDSEGVARALTELLSDGGTARNDAGGVALTGGAAR